jgi:4-carboxymuconolactone decarboxylase
VSFANSSDLKSRIEQGEAFDVAILTAAIVDDLVKQGALTASTRADVARAGAGVAIKHGAPRPDLSTAESFRRALIAATSVAYVGQGATAAIVKSIFDRFGIAAEMQAKTKLVLYAAEAVAAGEAELGFTQISEILPVAGVELAGPLPVDLQVYTVFSSAVSTRSPQPEAARSFISFLTTPAAGAVIAANGMEPFQTGPAGAAQGRAAGENRMPPIPAAQMTDAQKRAVEEFKIARGAELSGPFHPLLRSPELMTRTRAMGDYLRYKSTLPPRLSEFVILLTAREWTQQYEWHAHYRIALDAGLDPQVAQAVAEGRRPTAMTDDEALLYDFCRELQRTRTISDQTYGRARSRFGEQGVIDTIGLVGYYSMLAMVLNGTNAPLPAGVAPPLSPLPPQR